MRASRLRMAALAAVSVLVVAIPFAVVLPSQAPSRGIAQDGPSPTSCPAGYKLKDVAEIEAELRKQDPRDGGEADDGDNARASDGRKVCWSRKHPESLFEIGELQAERAAKAIAPLRELSGDA